MTIESIIESAIRGRATLSIFAILFIVATVLSALPVFAQEEGAVPGHRNRQKRFKGITSGDLVRYTHPLGRDSDGLRHTRGRENQGEGRRQEEHGTESRNTPRKRERIPVRNRPEPRVNKRTGNYPGSKAENEKKGN